MQIVAEETHRVLAYLDALNRHGAYPQAQQVEEYATEPDRKRPRRSGGKFSTTAAAALTQFALEAQAHMNTLFGPEDTTEETRCEHLERMGWARTTSNGGIEISVLGRALLRSLNTPVTELESRDVVEIVLDPDNPFAYAQALQSLSGTSDALLVEPYFRIEQLIDVTELGNIKRVLLGPRVKPAERKVLSVGLAGIEPSDRPHLRVAKSLHDRYLIPVQDGPVLMLGASLGGIGRKVSTLTTLGPEASQALRKLHDEIWESAAPIEPQAPPESTASEPGQSD